MTTLIVSSYPAAAGFTTRTWRNVFRQFRVEWRVRRSLTLALDNVLAWATAVFALRAAGSRCSDRSILLGPFDRYRGRGFCKCRGQRPI